MHARPRWLHFYAPISVIVLTLVASSCAKNPTSADGSGGTSGGGTGAGSGSGGSPATGSGGSGSGGSGSGGSTVMKDPSTYPQNTVGAHFPFPQGHATPHCTLPLYNTDSVALAYNDWKTKFFVGGRVVRPSTDPGADTAHPNDTVSEGIGYGMLIGVYMNDRPLFDALWTYASGKLDGNGLMNWRYDQGGGVIQGGSATDADEDMAWALLMAGAQWGGTYNATAVTLINNIWSHEVESGSNVLKPGDNFGGSSQTNPSYFAPSYYRAFAKATPSHDWMSVLTTSYNILALASGPNGLVPNWVNSSGAGVNGPNNDANGPYFGYDACRTPWRIALDWCENGDANAKAYLDKITAFYQQLAPTSVGTLRDGYTSTGTNPPGTLGDFPAGMAFFGPGGVAAMEGGHDSFATLVSSTLVSNSTTALMNISGVYTYFHATWGVLSLLPLSGNFWNMTGP